MKLIDEQRIPSNPYSELLHVLEIYTSEHINILGNNLVGMYLLGSIALDGFDLDSDVDYLVVTKDELLEDEIKDIQVIKENIQKMECYPAKHLEGSYICINDLNDWNTVGEKKLYYFDNGSTIIEQSEQDNKWLTRWVLREYGVVLFGQRPNTILPEIPKAKLLDETKKSMIQVYELYKEELNKAVCFWNSRFGQSFFVITYCRMLQTYTLGTVQSKRSAINWAMTNVDPEWIDLINEAWEEREGVRFGVKVKQKADSKLLKRTLYFMEYIISKIE